MTLIFGIAGLILLCGAISQGLRVANRIAVAAEATATIAGALYANMTPEAKAKAEQYLRGLKA